jgi:hypothetical protein
MGFGTWFMNKRNALTYILFKTWNLWQKIWDKKIVASATNVVATYMQILYATYAILT